MKRLLLPASIVIGIATLPAAGALTFLLTPRGNEWLQGHLENYLTRKLHTTVKIGRIHLRTIYHLTISDFILLDQSGNTLISFKNLSIDIQWGYWWKSDHTFLNDLRIERLSGIVDRKSGATDFNYQFLLDELGGSSTGPADKNPNLKWLIPELAELRAISLKYYDAEARDSAVIAFAELNTILDWQRAEGLKVKELKLLKSAFHFSKAGQQLAVDSKAGQIYLRNGDLSFARGRLRLKRAVVNDHFTSIRSGHIEAQNKASAQTVPWEISIDTLLVNRNRFSIDLQNFKRTSSKEFDLFHNDFQNVDIAATALRYRSDEISGRLSQLSFMDLRRFRLDAMETDFAIGTKTLRLSDLNLRTARNEIHGDVKWDFPSLALAMSDPETTRFKIAAQAARLNLGEITYFLPVLLRYPSIYPLYKQQIRARVQASGSPRNIRLDGLDIITDHNRVQGKGEIHIPRHKETWLVLDIKSGLTGKKGLLDVVSPEALSPALLDRIQEKVRLNGKVRITAGALQGSLALNSAVGAIRLKGSLSNFSDLNRVRYNLTFDGHRFEIGKILKDTLFGPVTAHGHVRGTGLSNPATIIMESAGYVDQMAIGGRQIKAVLFETRLANGRLDGNLASSQPDLHFELSPTIYFSHPDSLGNIIGSINNVDLQKLGFSKDSLTVGGWISANLSKFSADSLIGNLKISTANAQFRGKSLSLDHLTLDASHPGDQQVFQLKSGLADIDLSGRFDILQIPEFTTGLVHSILESKPFPTARQVASFKLRGDVHLPPEILAMTEELSQLAPFRITSAYERDAGSFEFQTQVDSLTLNGTGIDSVFAYVEAHRNNSTLATKTKYTLGAKNISSASLTLPHTQVSAEVREGVHAGALISSETSPGSLLRVPFSYNAISENPFLTLSDSLFFKGELWKVNPGNAIYPFAINLAGSKLTMTNGAKSATFAASSPDTQGLPYQLLLADISLGPIFALIKADSTFLTGSVSGSASVNQLQPLAFTARVDVDDLQLKGASLGELQAEVKSESADRYAVTMDIRNDRPVLNARGMYEPLKGAGTIAVDIDSFPVAPFSSLLGNEIDSLRGALSGHLSIRTASAGTAINGLVRIDSSTFAIRQTGTRIQIAAGGLAFAGDKVDLESVLLRDGAGGQATVTGSMDMTDDRNIRYRLKLDAKKFKTIGELRRREQLVYGSGKTDANLELSGNPSQFRLNGQVSINDSSQIFYRSAAISRPDFGDGLLEFAMPNQEVQPVINPAASSIARLINTNISVPSNATLTLLLDEYRGEKVVVRGKSNLNYSQHAGGEMQLNGKYEVASGTYTFTVGNNIRREFTLENGGTIQWMGDVYQPVCDLTAVYKVNTSAGALMQGTDADAEAGRRKFDFLVKLKLKGNLSKPDISFEIGMNETDQDAFDGAVYSKIKQINNSQSDATKQVMSLLVLNSFMGDSPFGSLSQFSSNALEAGAYNTIGNLLTRQLNNMLAGMVKVVDITLGVNWSESVDGGRSSTRSDIKLGLGKSLFNHRLNLYVGNNFGVETLSGSNSGISGLANDVSVEYLLNPEGKYRIKGYHVRDNELTLHGEHMETGVKFTIIWEFDQPEAKRGQKKTAR